MDSEALQNAPSCISERPSSDCDMYPHPTKKQALQTGQNIATRVLSTALRRTLIVPWTHAMSPLDRPEVAIFPEHRFALSQPRGIITGDTILDYGRAMAYAPGWEPGFTEVWDGTLCEDIDIVPSDMARFNELERETIDLLKGSRTLLIFDRPLIRITVQLYAKIVGRMGREIVTVKTQEEGARYLGIDAIPILT